MHDEGYIKFQCNWKDSGITIPEDLIHELNYWRRKLYDLSLIGAYANRIGYGNISIKNDDRTFYITGSSTGEKEKLSVDDYALVYNWEIEKNQLSCKGKTKASSESLTHAAIYETTPEIRSVIHIHSENMWKYYLNKIPTTSSEAEFGTPGMAYELIRFIREQNSTEKGIIVMGGHKEGIITFGRNMNEAGKCLLDYYYQSLNNSTISDPDCK